jgi:hypothetical protein
MGWGLYLAWTAAGLSLLSLVFHRMAYKPLFERMKRATAGAASAATAGERTEGAACPA